jgi:hypothetical protein
MALRQELSAGVYWQRAVAIEVETPGSCDSAACANAVNVITAVDNRRVAIRSVFMNAY